MELDIRNFESSVYIISAPSGVGKTTLRKMVLPLLPNLFYSVSYTTRQPRADEVDGQDYSFVTKEVFKKKVEAQSFLEWAQVHENYYGTPKEPIMEALNEKKDIFMDIDVQGARTLQKRLKGAIFIFLLPPSWDVLEKRLRSRKTETEEEVTNRLKTARKEIQHCWQYDYIIINNELEDLVGKLKAIIQAEHCRPLKMKSKLVNIL